MGIDFGKMFADAAKGVSDFFDNAGKDITKAIDQNGDGILDFSDIQTFVSKNQAAQEESRRKSDLERLKPLFPEDLQQAEFVLPKIICIAEIDKPHAENQVCKNSIGFRTILDDLSIITIFTDHVNDFDLSFYPEPENDVFYVDPCDRDRYISLDDYFPYMKMQRVAELQLIAQSLGAKHFRVVSKEKNESHSSNSVDVNASARTALAKANVEADHNYSNSSMSSLCIEAEMRFPGHAPILPEVHYLKNEINVVNLIKMRMDPLSPLQHQHFNIEMCNSSGIKVKDAVKIDAALKAMKFSANTTIISDAQNEARRILEYEIEF